jgi:hypothetical protein
VRTSIDATRRKEEREIEQEAGKPGSREDGVASTIPSRLPGFLFLSSRGVVGLPVDERF